MFKRLSQMMSNTQSQRVHRDTSQEEEGPARPASMLSGAFHTALQSLTRGDRSMSEAAPERQELHSTLQRFSQPTPFTQAVAMVNQNLASHGDTNLPAYKQQRYAEDTAATQSGDMSNAGAFARSAFDWGARFSATRDPAALTGAAFNAAGSIVAGSHDATAYKTGRALRPEH
ncbi:hypothetical protein [Burkholderia stagnalis]|uniref:Type III effector n=2 Tax=Burkholderia stagnalis TaxID=1503054 RepID=A0ABX9YC51_9BURK|nr:hypothetical protein [Burkholderia stagnalis]RQQ46043.1 hypothetical protein DF158_34900 [Burkholderia stagnalis]RQQ58984.1 hypothetical protein DF137_34535 [Burkholderia stagnalis]RQY78737.1 hypothetical protein DF017_35710 [Burkholderia stagnalis]RQZ04822.1 hypothetical protein DF016_35650 [Burkholderia stagnalis]